MFVAGALLFLLCAGSAANAHANATHASRSCLQPDGQRQPQQQQLLFASSAGAALHALSDVAMIHDTTAAAQPPLHAVSSAPPLEAPTLLTHAPGRTRTPLDVHTGVVTLPPNALALPLRDNTVAAPTLHEPTLRLRADTVSAPVLDAPAMPLQNGTIAVSEIRLRRRPPEVEISFNALTLPLRDNTVAGRRTSLHQPTGARTGPRHDDNDGAVRRRGAVRGVTDRLLDVAVVRGAVRGAADRLLHAASRSAGAAISRAVRGAV